MELNGLEKRDLRLAVNKAFPSPQELRRMVSDYLDENLGVITSPLNDLRTQVDDLIIWAGSKGKHGDLVLASRYANPDNPDLAAFAAGLGMIASDQPKSTLEALVSANTTFLDPHVWTAQLTRMGWRVCRVDVDEIGIGTGFLVGTNAVITNHHVAKKAIGNVIDHNRMTCLFDFMIKDDEVLSEGTRFELAHDDWLIDSSPHSDVDLEPDPKSKDPGDDELDFALLRLALPAGELGVAGKERAEPREWVEVPREPVDLDLLTSISILQHPNRKPLKLAVGMEQKLKLNGKGNRVRYTLPTLPGSSGSPVFDSDWRLVALHHSGDPDSIKPEFNEGIPISLIANRPDVSAYLDTAGH